MQAHFEGLYNRYLNAKQRMSDPVVGPQTLHTILFFLGQAYVQ